ncbi:MAG TPA: DegT/DnrJ/EryC1/StrS aminotransferase family protein [Caulobacteraceae bacterium]|nr:DegT/DnrJ/EryC1/StrS aminotransferase family protein [Caulobacteraceae bacterium]
MLPFIDLAAQQARLRPDIEAAIARVLAHGQYVMGPEVRDFEAQLAAFCDARLALSCANGTDALALPLMAWGVGPGDAVFCPSFTFAATPEVVPWTGAEPVFVDILPDTYCIDPQALDDAVEAVTAQGRLRPRAVIAVDLFGHPADYPGLAKVCRRHGLKLVADSAQGFGCTLDGRHPLHWADVATTSFFPAKPLGAYGDGGAVLINDPELWERMDSLRIHGKATPADGQLLEGHDPKYLNARVGMNSRLDTLQAAILIQKLKVFQEEIALRNDVADRYAAGLAGSGARAPVVIAGGRSTWAQYVIEHQDRDGLAAHLKTAGVPTAVYYPVPMHLQTPYSGFGRGPAGLPVSEAKAATVLALPMHPYLAEADQDHIIDSIRGYNG